MGPTVKKGFNTRAVEDREQREEDKVKEKAKI